MKHLLNNRLSRTATAVLLLATLCAGDLQGADLKAGFGRCQITPPLPILMAGFDNSTKPAESVATDLWTKALTLEDPTGRKVVVITVDLVTMPRAMIDMVAARVTDRHGLDRSQLVINMSHTHSGPRLDWPANTDREMMLRIETYRNKVIDSMTEAAADAVGDLQPAKVTYATGKVGFPHNRREKAPGGRFIFGMNPDGPVDQTVPVIRVSGRDGKLRGVLFGLSCHPSVLTYEFFMISGDYAGVAQADWEKAHPGATGMFMQLCGGDQNAYPRRKVELVEKHGHELSAEVERVIAAPMKPVHAPIKTALLTTELAFSPFSLEQFEKQAKDPEELVRTHAERLLKQYQSGEPPLPGLPYTMQAIQLGKDVTLLAMNGEVVIDYCLRVKKEYGAQGMIVAGYCNARPCYIPSLRVLKEGGYEARDSILMGPLPGPLGDSVEDTIFAGVKELMRTVGRPPVQ
jgi:neutral ceramidase